MMSKAEVLEWVTALPDDAEIGISDGAFLEVMQGGQYVPDCWIETGALPEGKSEL